MHRPWQPLARPPSGARCRPAPARALGPAARNSHDAPQPALERRPSRVAGRIAAAAPQALLEEPALHAVPRDPERRLEMLPRDGTMSPAQLELAQCGGIEGIVRQPFAVGDRVKLLEPSLGAVPLGDGDR